MKRTTLALLLTLGPLGVAACITDADLVPTRSTCPSPDDFAIVSQMMERRCGNLDCHGQEGRPFRVYGRTGLRKPESGMGGEYVSGGMVETTDAEIDANYHAACGVEPERMANVVAKKEPATTLTIVRKPRLEEAHKGGMVLPKGSAGDDCFTSWIAGAVDHDACVAELAKP